MIPPRTPPMPPAPPTPPMPPTTHRPGPMPPSREDACADPATPAARLEARELLTLQLLARGYSSAQVAHLCGSDVVAVLRDIEQALATLGATSVDGALTAALLRMLID